MHLPFAALAPFALFLTTLVAQDPLTKQALQRIDEVEKKEPALAVGDVKAANLLLNSLDQAGKRLNAVNDKTEAKWLEAKQRFDELRQKIDAKAKAAPAPTPAVAVDAERLAQLDKEIAAGKANFELLSTKHLADPARVQTIRKELDGLTTRLAAFPAADDAVKPVQARLDAFRSAFDAAIAQLERDVGKGADVTKRLAELDAKYDAKNLPAGIEPPFTEPQVTGHAMELRRWRDTDLPADREFLGEAAKNAAVDQQHVSRLRGWLDDGFGKRIAELSQQLRARLDADVDDGRRFAEFVLATDANDKDQVTNRILGKGRFDENMARLRAAEHSVRLVRALAITDGRGSAEHPAGAEVQKAIGHLQQLAVLCLDAVRMPPAVSADAELLRVATETLKNPEYGVPPAERLVVTAPKTRVERREGKIDSDSTRTWVTMHTYAYDRFQVTTAEKQGDETWLWVNTLLRFESGDPTTPLGRWLLAERFQLTRILPENVAK